MLNNSFNFLIKILGKQINNPIGIAAGFDKNAEVYNSLFRLGFGFVEVGTITPLKQYGNSKPRVFRLEEDEALINRLGFNNCGVDIAASRIRANLPSGFFGINIGPNKETKNRLEDYLICIRKFHKMCDYLTVNISSPNTENLRSFHNELELDELLDEIFMDHLLRVFQDIFVMSGKNEIINLQKNITRKIRTKIKPLEI